MSRAPARRADDAALMARVQGDDRDAFGMLYDRFATRAYRVARAVCPDASRAEAIVLDAFLTVWRGRTGYRADDGSLGGWVMGIVRESAIDALRGDRRRANGERMSESGAPGGAEEAAGGPDEAARLRSTLARLPAVQRDVIALACFGDLSAGEIATRLSLPLGTVTGRMRLGLDRLRAGESA